MVYVLNQDGQPLMPTCRYAKVRILLKQKMAKVISKKPFTIQLLYTTTNFVQPITLGIDSGYLNIGFSAITKKKELVSGEVKLLQGISESLKGKAMYRRQRRNRLRYRAPRFDNRRRSDNWLAPSIQHKLDSHIRFINKLNSLLPINKTILEVANFDIQKIKNPSISGGGYQNGEQTNFYNLREYIFYKDDYACQICGQASVPLEVHHIGYWKGDRSNRPGNLASVCTECHVPKNHEEGQILYGLEPKLKSFKEATFMSTVRWMLKHILGCEHTYGFETKSKRIALGLPKSHHNDAFCIAGGTIQKRVIPIYFKQIKRNNRSMEKFYDAKYIDIRTNQKVSGQQLFNGRRTRNKNNNTENLHKYRGEKVAKGKRTIRQRRYFYQPNDLVKYLNKVYTVKGTHNKGSRIIFKENNKSIKVADLTPYMFRKGLIQV